MKEYPLEINNVGSDEYILMSKGHHCIHLFMKVVRGEGYEWNLGVPTHCWVKAVPCNTGEYNCLYHFVEEGTRGAFPATYVHEAYGDETYEVIYEKR